MNEEDLTLKKCPKCGHTEFLVTAHVVQEWLVDGNENFIMTTDTCTDISHDPDDDDLWECAKCGYEACGSEFNVKKNQK